MQINFKGLGSVIPETVVSNDSFKSNTFFNEEGIPITDPTEKITKNLEKITGIIERRYITEEQQMLDIAVIAAQRAIDDAQIDPETIDGIILAHNFGNVCHGTTQVDMVPSVASRVKHHLRIKNPNCIAYDVIFGCPGWIQAVILARQHILVEQTNRYLVIGAETLSRVCDPHDRDSMIYADGAGAVILEANQSDNRKGIITVMSQTHSYEEAYYLYLAQSNKKDFEPHNRYIKMHGRKIYEFALKHVPAAMKQCLEKSGYGIHEVKKIFIHQANEKMDEAILKSFYQLYDIPNPPQNVMPMNIQKLGNSSVATIPTLLDSAFKKNLPDHELAEGDVILLASVGAGMNINAMVYVV
jgi:3-oxoacyl-[acyl-carrier-protein] synthase-3